MNELAQVEFRQHIQQVQMQMDMLVRRGEARDAKPDCPLRHHFTEVDTKYGCATYAREIFIPKGTLIVGKIHKHAHVNVVSQGKALVGTEFGKKFIEAPVTFISEPGLKRAVYAIEDTIWTTVHLVATPGEDHLGEIEMEIIAPDYQTLGLFDNTAQLQIGESK